MKDLFGYELDKPPMVKGKYKPICRGYAAPPGTGPPGETCKTCRFSVARKMSKNYWKCLKMQPLWTGGPGSDIRLKAPACKYWEERPLSLFRLL
jgi:hypothetical protein